MTAARVFVAGFTVHFKLLSRSAFDVMVTAVWPLVYATLAYFLFRAGHRPGTLLDASLGATVMGIWSQGTIAGASAIQRQRWLGTLEFLIGSPTPFWLVLLPITVAISAVGIYSLASTLLWGRLLFGIPIEIEQPLVFVLALPATIVGIGLLGFLMATTFVLYRAAWALGNAFEYPVWLITGLLVPVTLLPAWVEPISWVLAPTWGMRALRAGAFGGDAWVDIAMCVGLGAVYVALGAFFLERFLKLAREKASVALT